MQRTTELIDIHHWSKYNPIEPQYFRYTPNIIATGHKIVDVYQTLCNARLNLIFFQCNKFGELVDSDDKLSVKYAKSNFIINSLIYYNICIDLSWQVLWMFYNSESFDLMYDELYVKSTKHCDYISLIEFLKYKSVFPTTEKKKILLLIKHITDFFSNEFTTQVREKYNYAKHRGNYHIDGLGMNDESLSINLFGIRPLMLKRQELDITEWYNILIDFDNKFVKYFEYIISETMPNDYFDGRIDLSDMYNYGIKLQRYLNQRKK